MKAPIIPIVYVDRLVDLKPWPAAGWTRRGADRAFWRGYIHAKDGTRKPLSPLTVCRPGSVEVEDVEP